LRPGTAAVNAPPPSAKPTDDGNPGLRKESAGNSPPPRSSSVRFFRRSHDNVTKRRWSPRPSHPISPNRPARLALIAEQGGIRRTGMNTLSLKSTLPLAASLALLAGPLAGQEPSPSPSPSTSMEPAGVEHHHVIA